MSPVAVCPECGQDVPVQSGAGIDSTHLRPDTGSPITAQDVRVAFVEDGLTGMVDRLNRIARGAPERGDDERACVYPELDGPCSGCAERGDDEPLRDGEDRVQVWVSPDRTVTVRGERDVVGIDEFFLPRTDAVEWSAGSLPAMPPEVTEALTWLRENPSCLEAGMPMTSVSKARAATVVRWAMSLSNGHSDTGERAASEQDEDDACATCGHDIADHFEEFDPTDPYCTVTSCECESFKRVDDPSPRSWSLPAPPPDDVTVVHVGGVRFDRDLDMWRDSANGEARRWSELLDTGTVVEGEPQAAEPPDPEKDDAIAHMRVQDAIEQRLRDHGAGYEDEPWFADVIDGAAAAALAAAGAVRVDVKDEEEQA